MGLTGLDLWFWAIGVTGHIALLWVLWNCGRVKRFPVFTALIAISVVRTLVLYFTLHQESKYSYFLAYWWFAIGDLALQLAVVYEMASHVFRPLGVWAPDVRRSSFWIVCCSVAIAAGLTWLAAPPASNWRQQLVSEGNFFSSALMGELFVAMIALSATVGLPWRTHVARISQGLGFYSLVGILIAAGQSYFGAAHRMPERILSHIRMATYLSCVVYWIVTLWRDEPQTKPLPTELRTRLALLQGRVAYDLHAVRSWRKL